MSEAPTGWSTVELANTVELIMDYRGRTPKKLGLDWGGGAIPAISARNVRPGRVDFSVDHYLGSNALYRRWMTHGDMAEGDILITTEAPLGNVAFVPDGRRYILSQRTVLLRPKKGCYHSAYLIEVLQSPSFQQLLAENATGSTALGIQRARLERLPICAPNFAAQRRIGEALQDAGALVDLLERLIAKKRDLKQGMMQELLTGRTRLPGFAATWPPVTLGNVGATYGGLAGKSGTDFGHGAGRFITFVEVMRDARLRGTDLSTVDIKKGERQNVVRRGDVLFNGSSETPGEVALAAAVDFNVGRVYLNSFCFGYRLNRSDEVDPLFLAYLFRAAPGRQLIVSLAQGSTRYNIAKTKLMSSSIELPEFAEQQAIVSVLRDADDEIQALEDRLTSARAIKIGMMQELLTGRKRLPDQEVAT